MRRIKLILSKHDKTCLFLSAKYNHENITIFKQAENNTERICLILTYLPSLPI